MANWDDARAERDFRVNPPNLAPGQGSGDEWGDMPVGSSSIDSNSAFTGSDDFVGSVLNGSNGSCGDIVGNTPNPNYNKSPSLTPEWDDLAKGVKVAADISKKSFNGVSGFITELFKSFSNNTSDDWHNLGIRMFKVSMITILIGVFLLILKPIIPSIGQPQTLTAGGSITAIIGVILLFKFERTGNNENMGNVNLEENPMDIDPLEGMNDDFSFDDSEDVFESSEGSSDDDFNWEDLENDFIVEDESEEESFEMSGVGSDGFNVDDAINSVNVEQPGIWTRQYLYETYCKVLPNITPSYSKIESITSDGNDDFMMFAEYIRGAALQVGIKEENVPELEEIRQNLFIIQLRATRPTVAKEQEIADAVADMYSRDESGKVVKKGVYATVDSMIGVFVINIFTGNTAMVSLKDIYDKIHDYIKDVDVKMPFVWGISEMGEPYYCDLINCDSILISGEGRGGKSWKGQSIMAQLAMYHSPKELEFYVYDHKNFSSDYRYPSTVLPHVRYFCGDGKKINSGLKRLIDYTMNTTGKILADDECLNIKDYNKKHPNDKLPYRYIVVDELMSLMNSYDKDEQEEFRGYMSTIVSKLPYLGLRLILFPHRIIDYVISKNTYSLISSRAIVRQLNEDEVKNAVGVTRKQFPYKLINMGDMAIRSKEIAKGETVFCHAEVLTRTNDGNKEVFKFIGSVWEKLCPECKCLELGKNDSVGGRIGDEVSRIVRKSEPVDHTKGMREYEYQGFSNIDDTLSNLSDDSDDSSEDFWDDVLKGL